MSRSRSYQHSRKFDSEIRAREVRERLLSDALREDVDREPIKVREIPVRETHSINIFNKGSRLKVLMIGETAHVRPLS